MGLVISNYSDTMQQAMFVIFFFMMVMILISGLYTPINSMPQWAQSMTYINPLRYFIEVMRMVYLKGSGVENLHTQIFALFIFAAFFNTWAVLSYKKSK
jgi:ABC-2 type transport system permease protein